MFVLFKLGVSVGGLFSPEYVGAAWSIGKVFDLLKHLTMPVIIVGTAGTASLIRVMRATLLDELGKQYVITARAKGVSERASDTASATMPVAPFRRLREPRRRPSARLGPAPRVDAALVPSSEAWPR